MHGLLRPASLAGSSETEGQVLLDYAAGYLTSAIFLTML